MNANWPQLQFTILDCVDDSRYSEPSQRLQLPVLGVRDNGDEDSVVDLTEWVPLVSYIRDELRLGASVDIELRLVGTPALAHNQSSLAGIHRVLDRKGQSLEEPIVLEAHRRVLPGEGAAGVKSARLLGIYERQPDGTLKPFSAARCHELVQAGTAHVRAALAKACFTSSVKEYNFQALDASVNLNVRTEYVVGEEDHVRVRREPDLCFCKHVLTRTRAWQATAALRLARRELRACDGCILAGCPHACCIEEIGKPCKRCAQLGRTCTYLHAPTSCCDQGSGQRKACEQLSTAFDTEHDQWEEDTGCDVRLARPTYLRPLHGFLHGLKGLIGFFRNYRIVGGVGEGEFGVAFLTAIATSNGPAAKALLECTEADVFNYLDRHADATCYLTVHQPVQAVLHSVGHVKLTLAPEPFRVWAARVTSHENLLRPVSVAVNCSGELLFSDAEGHVIAGLTRNYPCKMIVLAGHHLEPGIGGENVCGTAARLRHPLQVALLRVAIRKEHLLICDTGNRRLRLLSNVQQLDATKPVIHTVAIGGLPQGERFAPRSVAVVRSHQQGALAPLLAIGDGSKSRVLLVAVAANLQTGRVLSEHQYNFASPHGLASLDNRLYIASKQPHGWRRPSTPLWETARKRVAARVRRGQRMFWLG